MLLAGLLIWTACGGSSAPKADASGLPVNRPVTQADLQGVPGAHLYFPGSTVVRAVGSSQTPTHLGEEPDPAYTGAILTAPTTSAALYTWYAAALRARGYSPATPFPPATQTSAWAWELHHRIQVQVGVFDPVRLRQDAGVSVDLRPGSLAYQTVLVGYPPGLPKD